MVAAAWYMQYGDCSMVFAAWWLQYGICNMVFAIWHYKYDIINMGRACRSHVKYNDKSLYFIIRCLTIYDCSPAPTIANAQFHNYCQKLIVIMITM